MFRRLSFMGLFVEDAFEDGTQRTGIGNELAQLVKPSLVLRTANPQVDVATGGIFLVEMLEQTVPVPFAVEVGIVGKTELDGATNDVSGFQVAIGLGDYLSINTAWCTRG